MSDTKTTKPLELIHMDVCGPMPVSTYGGSKYAATFLDDYTGYGITQLLKTKGDVADLTKSVLTALETATGCKVISVRTDNGSEYINNELDGFLNSKGIVHQTTVPYTPEQNGKAERLNRTLMEKAKSMLADSSLPPEAWGEALNTASYLRNRSMQTIPHLALTTLGCGAAAGQTRECSIPCAMSVMAGVLPLQWWHPWT